MHIVLITYNCACHFDIIMNISYKQYNSYVSDGLRRLTRNRYKEINK